MHPEQVEVEIWRADELEVRRGLSSELDEMWGFVQAKAHPRWLWHAIDHDTGKVLAYVFNDAKTPSSSSYNSSWSPCITVLHGRLGRLRADIDPEQHHVGKETRRKSRQAHQSPDPD